ncbi:hypothetical protein ATO10_14684 [Actibacterium atlanticum]|uniref:SURF1-like protein n=1 Tax=Actibacterium atlanticum TaxID=1461693 RepID=A0A058ZJC0_9RHOB|nr:SURF1 family protein [Actibacterium atlanticum]KCV80906.1 hypothetical protein ATO10_14684 [Actibacterium atlanticum]
MRRAIWPLLFGLWGAGILIWLGTWQMQRLEWKEAVLAEIDARIGGTPIAVPAQPDPVADRFLPVTATGTLEPGVLVLASVKLIGAGHRVVDVLDMGDRRVLLDRGFLKLQDQPGPRPDQITVTGNLHWPDEVDGYTPDPDLANNLWFARDVERLAAHLGTDPVLIVARTITPADPVLAPFPVNSAGIPNDHWEYAVTWYSLAVVWLGMTALLVWRIRRGTD